MLSRALEDTSFDRELRIEGRVLFLAQRKVMAFARRLEEYEVISLYEYYL